MRTRMCYLSGFYYLHTALFTFVGPLIPITLLLAMPWTVRLENLKLILPSVIYAALIFPMWHRCPYRLEAWAIRMMYGWAHAFAIWDSLRRRRLEWRPTGSTSRGHKDKTSLLDRHHPLGGTTSLVWVGAALWRMSSIHAQSYSLVLSAGLFYAVTVCRVLLRPPKDELA